jgi:hypothetical protein
MVLHRKDTRLHISALSFSFFLLLLHIRLKLSSSVMCPAPHVFAARIYKVGVIRYVDVPGEVSKSLGSGHIPVCGSVESAPLRTTLVPAGNGRHRLAIHSDIRKKLRIDAGAVVEISVELDEESREPVLPPALVTALKFSKVATYEFRAMSTALRRQIVRYLVAVKSQTTLERRCAKFVARLERNPPSKRKKSRTLGRKSLSRNKKAGR